MKTVSNHDSLSKVIRNDTEIRNIIYALHLPHPCSYSEKLKFFSKGDMYFASIRRISVPLT